MLTAARSPLHPPPTERRRGNRRGVRLGPASETSESTTLGSGSGPTDTRPATDDAPANRARGGEPHGRPRGAPRPRDGGVPPRERESEGAAATAPCGPLRPPDPGDGEATPPGVFKPTRRDAVARYPDRGRGRKRGRGETPPRRDTPRTEPAPSGSHGGTPTRGAPLPPPGERTRTTP